MSAEARDRLLRHAQRVHRIGQRLEEQRLERLGAATGSTRPGAPKGAAEGGARR
jgi:hypothetical protein